MFACLSKNRSEVAGKPVPSTLTPRQPQDEMERLRSESHAAELRARDAERETERVAHERDLAENRIASTRAMPVCGACL